MKDGKPWRVREAERLAAAKATQKKPRLTHKRLPPPKSRNAGYQCKPHPPVTPPSKKRKLPEDHNPHLPRGIKPWPVDERPKLSGRVVHIVGGGPSLANPDNVQAMRDCRAARPDDYWIVVNNSWKLIDWWDLLHFADCEWWRWHGKEIKAKCSKKLITTATSDVRAVKLIDDKIVKRIWRNRNQFSTDPHRLHGWDSGTQAVNLAYLLGAKQIVMWGIDMYVPPKSEAHWHPEHPRPTNIKNYQESFAPSLAEVVRRLYKLDVPVTRATEPGIPEAPYFPWPEAVEAPQSFQPPGGQP